MRQHFPAWSKVQSALLLMLLFLFAMGADSLAAVLCDRLALCLHTLIPSLFACMAVSDLLLQSGSVHLFGAWLRIPAKWLRWSANDAGIYLLSQLTGYPIGALLLRQQFSKLPQSFVQQSRQAATAFGGGPGFLVGFVGVRLTGSAAIGWMMLGCCCLGNLCAAMVFRPAPNAAHSAATPALRLRPAMITTAATHAMQSLLSICAIVCAFGCMTWLLSECGVFHLFSHLGAYIGLLPHQSTAILACLLDITQLQTLCQSGLPPTILFPLLTALLSFGGICAQWQCLTIGGQGLEWRWFVLVRLVAAGCAAFFFLLFLPLLPAEAVIATLAPSVSVSQSGSILPALLILCTGFPLLFKKD